MAVRDPTDSVQEDQMEVRIDRYSWPNSWRWRLTDDSGVLLLDEEIHIDGSPWQFAAFIETQQIMPWALTIDQFTLDSTVVEEIGEWVGSILFGRIAEFISDAPGPIMMLFPKAAEHLALAPWNIAVIGTRSLASRGIVISVVVSDFPLERAYPDTQPIRILALFSLLSGEPALNLRREREVLRSLVASANSAEVGMPIQLRILHYDVTIEGLKLALSEPPGWDVVHWSSHGAAGSLRLRSESGKIEVLDSSELIALLRAAGDRLRFVTLMTCEGAASRVTELVSSNRPALSPPLRTPPQLEEQSGDGPPAVGSVAIDVARDLGVAVMAMRLAITDKAAIEFTSLTYRRIFAGESVARAMGGAMSEIQGERHLGDYSKLFLITPILVGRGADRLRVRPPHPRGTTAKADPPRTDLTYSFVGREEMLQRIISQIRRDDSLPGLLLVGMPGVGKSAIVREAISIEAGSVMSVIWQQIDSSDPSAALDSLWVELEGPSPLGSAEPASNSSSGVNWLPPNTAPSASERICVVLDGIEGLLLDGRWRDTGWRALIDSIVGAPGRNRLIITTQTLPEDLPEGFQVEFVGGLSPADANLMVDVSLQWTAGRRSGGPNNVPSNIRSRFFPSLMGQPRLIRLATALAHDPIALEAALKYVVELPAVYEDGRSVTVAWQFLAYVNYLRRWILDALRSLTPESRAVLEFLCIAVPADRLLPILIDNWVAENEADGTASILQAIDLLRQRSLLQVDSPPTLRINVLYSVHPVVAALVLPEVSEESATVTTMRFATYWLRHAELTGGGNIDDGLVKTNMIAAMERALPYLERLGDSRNIAIVNDFRRNAKWRPDISSLSASGYSGYVEAPEDVALRLSYIDPARSVPLLEEFFTDMHERRKFARAASIATNLVRVYSRLGRFHSALSMAEYHLRHQLSEGDLWSQLNARGQVLQVKNWMGIGVLPEAKALLAEIEGQRPKPATVGRQSSRQIWEYVLGIAQRAARDIGDDVETLRLSAINLKSRKERNASDLEVVGNRLNDADPLFRLNDLAGVAEMLAECNAVVWREGDLGVISVYTGIEAHLEYRQGQYFRAQALQRRSLVWSYRGQNVENIRLGHRNLGQYLWSSGSTGLEAISNFLVAAVLADLTLAESSQWIVDQCRVIQGLRLPADVRDLELLCQHCSYRGDVMPYRLILELARSEEKAFGAFRTVWKTLSLHP
jgi:hypothetical protein